MVSFGIMEASSHGRKTIEMKNLLAIIAALVLGSICSAAVADDCPDGLCPLRRQVPTLAERPVVAATVELAQCASHVDRVQEVRPVRSVLVRIVTLPRRCGRCR